MKIVVGLGNPGPEYEKTRHNAGFMLLDRVLERWPPADAGALWRSRFSGLCAETRLGSCSQRAILVKPMTYMNRCGKSVAEALRFYKPEPEDLLVIVDDVALACGSIRLRAEGGAGGHNGLSDIQRAIGTKGYARLRIGIDKSPGFMDQADWVLGRFTPEQESLLNPALDRAADAVGLWACEGIEPAMNRYNAGTSPQDGSGGGGWGAWTTNG